MEKKSQGFIKGAVVLSLSGIAVKVIGVFFRIPLTNLVGSAAMSYYSSAYSVYILLLAIATSGLPTGISVVVSRFSSLGDFRSVNLTVKIAFFFFSAVGLTVSFFGILFSKQIAVVMNSEEAVFSVAAIMPAVFFISVVSVFRGYFQGLGNMTPTAVSNVIEALVKVGFGYGIAAFLYNRGYAEEIVVGGAVLGVTVGTVFSAVYMLIRFLAVKEAKKPLSGLFRPAEEKTKIFRSLISVTLPVTLSAITSSLMGTIDSFLVMSRLREYTATDVSRLLWGAYANMSQTIFNLPSFITVSVSTSLVPAIASAFVLRKKETLSDTVGKAFTLSSVISIGSALFVFLTAEDILYLLFGRDPSGVEVAVPLLKILGFALIPVGFTNVTSAVLNSLSASHLSVFSVAVGAVVKILLTYILVGIPEINISGAPVATNIAYPVMLVFNLIFIRKKLGFLPFPIKKILLVAVSAFAACFSAKGITAVFSLNGSHFWNFLLCFSVFFIVYISLLFLFGIIDFCGILRNFTKMKKSS